MTHSVVGIQLLHVRGEIGLKESPVLCQEFTASSGDHLHWDNALVGIVDPQATNQSPCLEAMMLLSIPES